MKWFIYLFMKRAIVALSESTAFKGLSCFEVWVRHVTQQSNQNQTENVSRQRRVAEPHAPAECSSSRRKVNSMKQILDGPEEAHRKFQPTPRVLCTQKVRYIQNVQIHAQLLTQETDCIGGEVK